MSDSTYQFTPLRMHTPLDNLTAAISIIQTQILASDTDFNPKVIFGNWTFSTDQMQVAVALLTGILAEVEEAKWRPEVA